MGKKGLKGQKNVPELYDEVKRRVNLALTPTSVDGLDAIAASLDVSRSELVERIGRGMITLNVNPLSEEDREAIKKHSPKSSPSTATSFTAKVCLPDAVQLRASSFAGPFGIVNCS